MRAQVEPWLSAHDDVLALWQWPEPARDPLPALAPHDDGVAPNLLAFGHARKVGHLLREPPGQGRVASDRVRGSRGDDEGERDLWSGRAGVSRGASSRPSREAHDGAQASSRLTWLVGRGQSSSPSRARRDSLLASDTFPATVALFVALTLLH